MARSKKTKSKSVVGPRRSLNAPKKTTYWVSLIIAGVGILLWMLYALHAVTTSGIDVAGFMLVAAAFVLLAISLTIKEL